MRVVFVERDNAPERLVCEAEVVFEAEAGPLAGMKLVGFSLWRSPEGEVYVTFPSRAFGSGTERRFFDFLRSVEGTAADAKRVKAWILEMFSTRERPEASPERGGETGGHVVEVAPHGGGVPVVHDRAVGSGRSELDVREARLEEADPEDVGPRRDAHPQSPVPESTRTELLAGSELGPARGHEADEDDLGRDGDLLALLLLPGSEIGERGLEDRRAGQLSLHEADALRLLRRLEEAPAERPARAHDDVGGHPPRARALGRGLHGGAPLRAQPRPLGEGGEGVVGLISQNVPVGQKQNAWPP